MFGIGNGVWLGQPLRSDFDTVDPEVGVTKYHVIASHRVCHKGNLNAAIE